MKSAWGLSRIARNGKKMRDEREVKKRKDLDVTTQKGESKWGYDFDKSWKQIPGSG